jgi:hypothetical protein
VELTKAAEIDSRIFGIFEIFGVFGVWGGLEASEEVLVWDPLLLCDRLRCDREISDLVDLENSEFRREILSDLVVDSGFGGVELGDEISGFRLSDFDRELSFRDLQKGAESAIELPELSDFDAAAPV